MAKSDEMDIVLGTWMSTLVLAPLGVFFTYKSNKDSVVFNIDVYAAFFRKLFGIRQARHLYPKEVIIDTPDWADDAKALREICQTGNEYRCTQRLKHLPNYVALFTNHRHDEVIARLSERMEGVIEDLSNTKDGILLGYLNRLPVLYIHAHKSLSDRRWVNVLAGLALPVGLVAYLRSWRYRLRLDKDLAAIAENSERIIERIGHLSSNQ